MFYFCIIIFSFKKSVLALAQFRQVFLQDFNNLPHRSILPLFGKTVAVTRNKTSEAKFTKLLETQGAQVLHFPTIEIAEISPNPPLEEALKNLSAYHWLIFTSGNAVDIFFKALFQAGYDIRALHHINIAAIGKPSARKLTAYHLNADLVPAVFTSEKLVDEMTASGIEYLESGHCRTFAAGRGCGGRYSGVQNPHGSG